MKTKRVSTIKLVNAIIYFMAGIFYAIACILQTVQISKNCQGIAAFCMLSCGILYLYEYIHDNRNMRKREATNLSVETETEVDVCTDKAKEG